MTACDNNGFIKLKYKMVISFNQFIKVDFIKIKNRMLFFFFWKIYDSVIEKSIKYAQIGKTIFLRIFCIRKIKVCIF